MLLALTAAVSSLGLLPADSARANAGPLAGTPSSSNPQGTPAGDASPVTPPLVALAATPDVLNPGESASFTATVANIADMPLTQVWVELLLPRGLVYVEDSAQGFAYSPSERRLTWQISAVQPGEQLSGVFAARAQGLAMGEQVQLEMTTRAT